MKNDIEIFKINILLTALNYLKIALILIIISFFSHASLKWAYEFVLIIIGLYVLFSIAQENLRSVEIFKNTHEVKLIFNRFIFFNRCLKLDNSEFYFSYKAEIVGRGSERLVFTLYDLDKQKIIKIIPFVSGWSNDKIETIVNLWKDLGVQELI